MRSRIFAVAVFFLAGSPIGTARAQNLGEACTPRDPAPRPGMSCQCGGEWDYEPPRISNAKKGDVLLSAQEGLVRGLLRQVQPAHNYSHSGIMVRNFEELTNSTASAERLMGRGLSAEGPVLSQRGTDGFEEDFLRYGWPGSIRWSIEKAYEGTFEIDPQGIPYWFQAFSPFPLGGEGSEGLLFPKVVKPPVETEAATRPVLERTADEATRFGAHYRFFVYSNADIVGNAAYVAAPGTWAHPGHGEPSVCTQLVWTAARRAGALFEGTDTEGFPRASAADAGADGLYRYSEEERRAAGEWLYANVYDKAYESVGSLALVARALTDFADDAANQMANCFGLDRCDADAKDEDLWRNPGTGVAIGPDDILQWDAPPGGVYGDEEAMEYVPGRYACRGRWAASAGTGSLDVEVLEGQRAIAGADVVVAAPGLPSKLTDARGRARFDAVPAGRYGVSATKGQAVERRSTVGEAEVAAGGVRTVRLNLSGPAAISAASGRRQVTIRGGMFIQDYDWSSGNETGRFDLSATRTLDAVSNRREQVRFTHCADEVRLELTVDLQLEGATGDVSAAASGVLFEGTSCDTNDRDGEAGAGVVVAANQRGSLFFRAENREEEDLQDYATVSLEIANEPGTAVPPTPTAGRTPTARRTPTPRDDLPPRGGSGQRRAE